MDMSLTKLQEIVKDSEGWGVAVCKIAKSQTQLGKWTTKSNEKNSVHIYCYEYIMRNVGLEEAQAGIKIARRNTNNLRYADDTTLMAESKE